MQHPKISLCMIVKNEADHLARCLQSVDGVVDEIIVVDTGSTDDTAEIARRYGANIIFSPWQDDFAYSRNVGLKHAKGDWILFLDADEELDNIGKYQLREFALHDEFEAFFLQIHNYVGDSNHGATINPVLRMFRNRSEYRFEGRIHEQIATRIFQNKPDASFHITEIKIHHYGYRPEMVVKKEKIKRNINLLMHTLAERPDDAFHLYNIGVEYLRIGDVEKALASFRQARSYIDVTATSYAHLIFKYEIRCLQTLGKTSEALQVCIEGIDFYPEYTDLHYLKGICHITLGQFVQAKSSLISASKLGVPPAQYHTEEGIGTYQVCYTLGLLAETEQDYMTAIDWYIKAIQYKPSLNPPLYRTFHLMRCLDVQDQIIPLLNERFHMKSSDALKKVIHILVNTGCLEAAKILLHKLPDADYREFKYTTTAKCKLLSGDRKGARTTLHLLKNKHKETSSPTIRKLKSWLSWLEGKKVTSFPLFILSEEIIREFQFGVKMALADEKIEEARHLVRLWQTAVENTAATDDKTLIKLAAHHLARTHVLQADFHMEALIHSTEFKRLIGSVRLTVPYEDGF